MKGLIQHTSSDIKKNQIPSYWLGRTHSTFLFSFVKIFTVSILNPPTREQSFTVLEVSKWYSCKNMLVLIKASLISIIATG